MQRHPINARQEDRKIGPHVDPKDTTILISDELAGEHHAVYKSFPNKLPKTWKDPEDNNREKNVTWISNFEVKRKDNTPIKEQHKDKTYTVELPKGEGKVVYLHEGQVKKLDHRQASDTHVHADIPLSAGDPPIGWGTPPP